LLVTAIEGLSQYRRV